MNNRNERRKTHYNELIKSGFTPKEATTYKHLSKTKVEALCDLKKSHDKVLLDRMTDILSRKSEENK